MIGCCAGYTRRPTTRQERWIIILSFSIIITIQLWEMTCTRRDPQTITITPIWWWASWWAHQASPTSHHPRNPPPRWWASTTTNCSTECSALTAMKSTPRRAARWRVCWVNRRYTTTPCSGLILAAEMGFSSKDLFLCPGWTGILSYIHIHVYTYTYTRNLLKLIIWLVIV